MLHKVSVARVAIMHQALPHVRDASRWEELVRRVCVELVSDSCQSCLRGALQSGWQSLREHPGQGRSSVGESNPIGQRVKCLVAKSCAADRVTEARVSGDRRRASRVIPSEMAAWHSIWPKYSSACEYSPGYPTRVR
jgi:hypothetical protein